MSEDKKVNESQSKSWLAPIIGSGIGTSIGTAIGLIFGQAIFGDPSKGLVWGITIGAGIGAGGGYIYTFIKSAN